MSVLVCQFQGRMGNACMQYLYARAYAKKHGFDFQCDPWIGERIFQIENTRPGYKIECLPRYNEVHLASSIPENSFVFRGYAQQQSSMLYTNRQAQEWLKLRPEIESACASAVANYHGTQDRIVCHRRVGDLIGYGYPVVSLQSYKIACERFGLNWDSPGLTMLSEEDPTPHAVFLPDDLSFMPDFYRMMKAPTLLRANSSFSWLAALLGNGLVLSPVIDGLEGGKEHDCRFVAGNHPRFCNLDFVSDLYTSP